MFQNNTNNNLLQNVLSLQNQLNLARLTQLNSNLTLLNQASLLGKRSSQSQADNTTEALVKKLLLNQSLNTQAPQLNLNNNLQNTN
mmetsp:Transcript_31386/g.28569  ORF Transcript_31386/g.28569 Transcript_31386/m.28569 type:complete len:86 (+) Transcript_31386:91-348(+)